MLEITLKLVASFLIGRFIGKFFVKNELSPILGLAMTFACVIAACLLIDKAFTDVIN